MSSEPSKSASVLLVAGDGASLASLQPAAEVLTSFGVRTETAVLTVDGSAAMVSADHRAIIVASPDAALPGALAAQTERPVVRVPIEADGKSGVALLDDGTGNLPAGPADGGFSTMSIGQAGAKNAALFVVSSLAFEDERLRKAWAEFRAGQTEAVLRHPPLMLED